MTTDEIARKLYEIFYCDEGPTSAATQFYHCAKWVQEQIEAAKIEADTLREAST
jgi:hypothetical protein